MPSRRLRPRDYAKLYRLVGCGLSPFGPVFAYERPGQVGTQLLPITFSRDVPVPDEVLRGHA